MKPRLMHRRRVPDRREDLEQLSWVLKLGVILLACAVVQSCLELLF